MDDKLKIAITRTRGYSTLESREITVDFPGNSDEDLLRKTFAEAEEFVLNLRDSMDAAGERMQELMELREPINVAIGPA